MNEAEQAALANKFSRLCPQQYVYGLAGKFLKKFEYEIIAEVLDKVIDEGSGELRMKKLIGKIKNQCEQLKTELAEERADVEKEKKERDLEALAEKINVDGIGGEIRGDDWRTENYKKYFALEQRLKFEINPKKRRELLRERKIIENKLTGIRD